MTPSKFSLYFLYSTQNGRVFYVGITKRRLEDRLLSHFYESRRKNKDGTWALKHHRANKLRLLNNKEVAIEKLLEADTLDEICDLEKKYIAWCRSTGFKLCNTTIGGQTGPINYKKPEWLREHLKRINSGSGNPSYGKSPSVETRAKQRAKLKGKPNPGLLNPEKKKLWRRRITENHADVSGSKNPMFGKSGFLAPRAKSVEQWSKDRQKKIAVFGSGREAARQTGVKFSLLWPCLVGKKHEAGGFAWQYANKVSTGISTKSVLPS